MTLRSFSRVENKNCQHHAYLAIGLNLGTLRQQESPVEHDPEEHHLLTSELEWDHTWRATNVALDYFL